MTELSYEEFEKQAEIIRQANQALLTAFRSHLEKNKLKNKTIDNHVFNVEFYLNTYLLRDELNQAADGVSLLNGFFDWFFPRKAMWSGVGSTKATIASLKKFYKFMLESERIEASDYREMLDEIKEFKEEWLSHYDLEDDYDF